MVMRCVVFFQIGKHYKLAVLYGVIELMDQPYDISLVMPHHKQNQVLSKLYNL